MPTVNIISLRVLFPIKLSIFYHEDVVCLWNRPSSSKQFKEVIELTMDITTYRHRGANRLDVGLLNEYVLDDGAQAFEVRLRDAETLLEELNPLVHHGTGQDARLSSDDSLGEDKRPLRSTL